MPRHRGGARRLRRVLDGSDQGAFGSEQAAREPPLPARPVTGCYPPLFPPHEGRRGDLRLWPTEGAYRPSATCPVQQSRHLAPWPVGLFCRWAAHMQLVWDEVLRLVSMSAERPAVGCSRASPANHAARWSLICMREFGRRTLPWLACGWKRPEYGQRVRRQRRTVCREMSGTDVYSDIPEPGRHPHLVRCGWFWAWAAVGAIGAVGLLSLGPIALAPAMVAGVAMTRSRHGSRSAFGLLAGAGLLLLYVAYVQRDGPGTTCWHTAAARGCDQHLNPIPWLVVGIVLLVGAVVAQTRHAA